MSTEAGHGRANDDLSKRQEDMVQMCINFFGDPLHVNEVSDRSIAGPDGEISLRIYQPAHDGPLPLMVYFHGGGFAFGSISGHDAIARRYASALQAVVVSVEYRLAPEHKFPAGLHECYAATVWAHEHAEEIGAAPETLCVAGDSAGGGLSAAVALMARDKGAPHIALQLMVCPCCDDPRSGSYASYALGTDGSMPSHKHMIELYDMYVPSVEDGKKAYVSPIHAEDLSDLPPALIFTAGKDMLMDEAEVYATRLAEAGVDVLVKRFKDNMHVGMSTPIPSSRDCQLALSLIRAQWEHARTADDEHPFDPMGESALKNLSSSKNGESPAKL